MRTRTIMTVALLTVAGCGTSGTTRQERASQPAPAIAPAPSVTSVPPPVAAPSAPMTAAAAPMVFRGPEQLELLADELRATDPAKARADAKHFRPLCDDKGYPLVGNLATKSMDPGPIATFCADVIRPGC